MILGPAGFDKIAVIGSAPSSVGLAPFDDPSWAIWACSPGAFGQIASKRSDVWFELHRWLPYHPGKSGEPGTKAWFSPEFAAFLAGHKGPVFMSAVDPIIKQSVRYPFEEMVEKYGPYFFSSSLAWMLALAIEQRPKAIGIFGVDMAATEEYAYQRPACQHFIGMAKALGIEVVLPPESDLMRPGFLYGLGELHPRHIKLSARLQEMHNRRGAARQMMEQGKMQDAYLSGAIEDLEYVLQSWSDDIVPDEKRAMSFAAQYVAKPSVPALEAKARKKHEQKIVPLKGNGEDHANA